MREPINTMPAQHSRMALHPLAEGVALGVVYGILMRLFIGWHALTLWVNTHDKHGVTSIMTVAFLMLGPFAIGFLTIERASRAGTLPVWQWFFAPWLTIILMMCVFAALAWEGAICILMALPIALVLASLGGILAGLGSRRNKLSRATLSCVALLPFIAAPAESLILPPLQTRTVENTILIHASTQTVWQNIERVPAIAPSELRPNWTHRIGFPRPVEATLSYEGVGGVRHASFERGLLFVETVTAWEPEHRIAFTIKADSAHIPTTTLDEHVTIGGRYFDVLDGEYTLEPMSNGDILLHLISHQRLSTDFNGYAGLWTDAVMQNLQSSILEVIKHRCEHA